MEYWLIQKERIVGWGLLTLFRKKECFLPYDLLSRRFDDFVMKFTVQKPSLEWEESSKLQLNTDTLLRKVSTPNCIWLWKQEIYGIGKIFLNVLYRTYRQHGRFCHTKFSRSPALPETPTHVHPFAFANIDTWHHQRLNAEDLPKMLLVWICIE